MRHNSWQIYISHFDQFLKIYYDINTGCMQSTMSPSLSREGMVNTEQNENSKIFLNKMPVISLQLFSSNCVNGKMLISFIDCIFNIDAHSFGSMMDTEQLLKIYAGQPTPINDVFNVFFNFAANTLLPCSLRLNPPNVVLQLSPVNTRSERYFSWLTVYGQIKYLLTTEFRFDAMLCFISGNENSDVVHNVHTGRRFPGAPALHQWEIHLFNQ